ncbi:Contactin-5-like 3, partial [Homarus americanus]
LSTGLNEKYNYNYAGESYYYDYEVGEEDQPTFLARSQIFTVEVGQSVIIPCDVENAGNNKLIIKKVPAAGGKEKLLVVGNERVTKDRRITVEGSRLTISHARPRDAGIFLCMFEMDPPIQLKHTLDVQFAPSIRSLAPPEQHVAKGITVTLECKAQGNPEPTIRWSRQEGPLPSGLRSEEGKSLTLEGVDRHVEGTYLCTADNGIGESASAAMTIAAIVRTGEGDKVELVCLVRGRPSPDVTWTRDGHPLPDTDMDTKLYLPGGQNASTKDTHLRVTHAAHRHILTINKVSEKDFGAYVCIAENSHGQKDAVIQMTGRVGSPQAAAGNEQPQRRGEQQVHPHLADRKLLPNHRVHHQSNRTMVMAGSWENVSRSVEKDEVKVEDDTCHSMAFTVTGLEVATDYLAVIRVRNRYGWSSESQHFSFSTKKAMAVLQSTSGARSWTPASSPSSSSPLFYILLLLAFFLAEI